MGDLGLHVCDPPTPPHCTQHPPRPPQHPLHLAPSLAMLELKKVSLTLQTTWPRCRPVDTSQLLSQSTKYPHRWHLVTWVCGFSIKDSIHPDRLLRRRDCFRHNAADVPRQGHPPSGLRSLLAASFTILFYSFITFSPRQG